MLPDLFPLDACRNRVGECPSPLLAAHPMRRLSGILPLHGAAHKNRRLNNPKLVQPPIRFISLFLIRQQFTLNQTYIPSPVTLYKVFSSASRYPCCTPRSSCLMRRSPLSRCSQASSSPTSPRPCSPQTSYPLSRYSPQDLRVS